LLLAIEAELRWDRGRGSSEVLDNAPSGGWVEIKLTRNAQTADLPASECSPADRDRETPPHPATHFAASVAISETDLYRPRNAAENHDNPITRPVAVSRSTS
jgi:hypothetical protein